MKKIQNERESLSQVERYPNRRYIEYKGIKVLGVKPDSSYGVDVVVQSWFPYLD